jgi:putative integral membrane protein (TIGR02587 family)
LLFTLPMLLTIEMWWLGFTMPAARMAILLAVTLPTLMGLAYYSGFEKPDGFIGIVVDALVAYCVGVCIAAVGLAITAVVRTNDTMWNEVIGKIVLQAIPASFGAVLAASQLGDQADEVKDENLKSPDQHADTDLGCYFRELFLMFAGAIFFAFNVAPTDEMLVIALKMTAWHAIAMGMFSLVVMHAFVFVVKFRGQEQIPDESSQSSVFLRFTIPGYAIALLVSVFCMWVFGRSDGTAMEETLVASTVLAMPASVGAAAARLIL